MKRLKITKYIAEAMCMLTLLIFIIGKAGYAPAICEIIPYPNIMYVMIISTSIFIFFFLFPQLKMGTGSYFLVPVVCCFLCMYCLFSFDLAEKPVATTVESPDGKHHLVFVEYYQQVHNRVWVYEKKNFILMQKLTDFGYRDFDRFMEDENYMICWSKKGFTVYLERDGMDWDYEVVYSQEPDIVRAVKRIAGY